MNELIRNTKKKELKLLPQIVFFLREKKKIIKKKTLGSNSNLHNNTNYLHLPFGKPITKSIKLD
jgi:hypothetical protein